MVGDRTDDPSWVPRLVDRLGPLSPVWQPSDDGQRAAAVLALLSLTEDPDLVLTVRAANLAHHAGQISLPGGGREAADRSPSDTALRETCEEIGLPTPLVRPVGQMGTHEISVSANRVIPVVGVWSGHETIAARDTAEVALIVRWPVSLLAAPETRVTARHPGGGQGPAWQVGELFLWGFTGYLVDALLRLGGWEQEWDTGHVVEVPPRFRL